MLVQVDADRCPCSHVSISPCLREIAAERGWRADLHHLRLHEDTAGHAGSTPSTLPLGHRHGCTGKNFQVSCFVMIERRLLGSPDYGSMVLLQKLQAAVDM